MQYLDLTELEKMSSKELPITKGNGKSPENAYVLDGVDQFLAPSLERMIVDLMMKEGEMKNWMMKRQVHKTIDGREIDVMEFMATKNDETKIYNFYFDLTAVK